MNIKDRQFHIYYIEDIYDFVDGKYLILGENGVLIEPNSKGYVTFAEKEANIVCAALNNLCVCNEQEQYVAYPTRG